MMELIAYIVLGIGVALIALANFGLFKFPDVFCRAHAMTKSLTLGISLILIAGWGLFPAEKIGIKALITVIFLYTTIPLSGHILALIAFRKNVPRWRHQDIK